LRQEGEYFWHQRLDVGPSDSEAHTLSIHRTERHRSGAVIDAATGTTSIGRCRVERRRKPLAGRLTAAVYRYPIAAAAFGRGLRLDGIGRRSTGRSPALKDRCRYNRPARTRPRAQVPRRRG
jgi:hypothetical protein